MHSNVGILWGGSTPTEVVEDNLKKMQNGEESEYLKKAVQQIILDSSEEYYSELEHEIIKLYEGIVYEVVEEEINGNEAFVCVNIDVPDLLSAVKDSTLQAIADMERESTGENFTIEDSDKRFRQYMVKGINKAQKKKKSVKFKLSKKLGKWTLDENEESFKAILGLI